jgi:four helix bundle protein
MSGYHPFDLEERTFKFALAVRKFFVRLPGNLVNSEDGKQLLRSSGSVGSNYIEANDGFSEKDFIFRLKICRKEAKESSYFLRLISSMNDPKYQEEANKLNNEAIALKKIFSAILQKWEKK